MKEVVLGIWIPLTILVAVFWSFMEDTMVDIFCGAYFLGSVVLFLVAVF